MHKLQRFLGTTFVTIGAVALLAGCGGLSAPVSTVQRPAPTQPAPSDPPATTPPPVQTPPVQTPSEQPTTPPPDNTAKPGQTSKPPNVTVVAKPADITVLVNKVRMLPDGYKPSDLVEPNVPFIFTEKAEKRLMRKEAAQALEQMFAGAKKGGIFLAGVSGYRSYETQKGLFDYYVKTQGEATARRYSAEPGYSEHQTGLAMDISGSTGKCAADDCFADTPEAKWLAAHAPEYGFIIRYPKGKEAITGYSYEPWHVRYLGKALAQKVAASGLTYEEYQGTAN
jgi:D-alanyl-D-alanine carboxypeptidase